MSRKAVSDDVLLIFAHFELCNFPSKLSSSMFSIFLCLSLIEVFPEYGFYENLLCRFFCCKPLTFCSYKKLANFTTNVDAENQIFGYHKSVMQSIHLVFAI